MEGYRKYYNREKLHSSLGYKTPWEFHATWQQGRINQPQQQPETVVSSEILTILLALIKGRISNETVPLYSIIVLAQPIPNPNSTPNLSPQEDDYLTPRALLDLHPPADMGVLSACDTGRGQKRSGEGITGLSWALFAAGAPSQVVSQWEVNDQGAAP